MLIYWWFIAVPSPYDTRVEATKDLPADTGAFLPYAFFALLIFTVAYNILFIKVIKPSVDGQVELAPVRPSIMRDILKSEILSLIQLPPSAGLSVKPWTYSLLMIGKWSVLMIVI